MSTRRMTTDWWCRDLCKRSLHSLYSVLVCFMLLCGYFMAQSITLGRLAKAYMYAFQSQDYFKRDIIFRFSSIRILFRFRQIIVNFNCWTVYLRIHKSRWKTLIELHIYIELHEEYTWRFLCGWQLSYKVDEFDREIPMLNARNFAKLPAQRRSASDRFCPTANRTERRASPLGANFVRFHWAKSTVWNRQSKINRLSMLFKAWT